METRIIYRESFAKYRQSPRESLILEEEELPFRCSVGEFVDSEDGMQRVKKNGKNLLKLALAPGDAVLLRFQDAREEAFLIDYVLKK